MDTHDFSNSLVLTLGREADLAFAEVKAVVDVNADTNITRIGYRFALVQGCTAEPKVLQEKLGGTVKIGTVLKVIQKSDHVTSLINEIELLLPKLTENLHSKITFAVQFAGEGLNQDEANTIARALKQYFTKQNISSRFVRGNETGLTSVQLDTQNILNRGFELLVISDEKSIYISQTTTYQDYKQWAKVDYGRPKSNPKRGMLPPKLARMLINIAQGYYSNEKSDLVLLDPFCGEGTILLEGLRLGMTVSGSDIDVKAVADTKLNIDWCAKSGLCKGKLDKLIAVDIAALDHNFAKQSVDLLITEPYLGPPVRGVLSKQQLESTTKEYSRLLKNLFIHAAPIIKANGILTVVVPMYREGKFSQLLVDKILLDSCENFGYTPLERPLSYTRPDAKIGRMVHFFRKQ